MRRIGGCTLRALQLPTHGRVRRRVRGTADFGGGDAPIIDAETYGDDGDDSDDRFREPGEPLGADTVEPHRSIRSQDAPRSRLSRRVASGVLALAAGALGVHLLGASMAAPPPAPVVRLTPAQTALADALPAHPGTLPVLDAGRVSEHSTTAEPAMSPRAFALTVATLHRAGYTFVAPGTHGPLESQATPATPVDATAGKRGPKPPSVDAGLSGRSVVLAVDADPETIAAVDPILERFDARAVAVTRDRATPPPTGVPATPATLNPGDVDRHRWTLATSLPADDGSVTLIPLAADTTPESVVGLLRTAVPTPVRLDSATWTSRSAHCTVVDGTVHVALDSGASDPDVSDPDPSDSVCRPALNATAWQDYRLITDIRVRRGTAVIVLRDRPGARAGRVEVRIEGAQVTVVETGDHPTLDRVLGYLPLSAAGHGGTRRIEAGIEDQQVTVAVDEIPVRTEPASSGVNPTGGIGLGALEAPGEATFDVMAIAGR